jgi:hypothetical protein
MAEVPQKFLYIATNAAMWEEDRFVVGITCEESQELVNMLSVLGDVFVVVYQETEMNINEIMTILHDYRVPHIVADAGLTDHVVMPLRNLADVLEVVLPDVPNKALVPELYGADALQQLYVFLKHYHGSRLRNRIFAQFNSHLKSIGAFTSMATFDACMRNMRFKLTEKCTYEVITEEVGTILSFKEKPDVRVFVKDE